MKVKIFLPGEQFNDGIIFPTLVHGAKVVEILIGTENVEGVDGLVTKNKNLTLGIKTGDCAPICFSDGETIGIAHVGWPGLCAGMIENILPFFNKAKLEVFVGPFIHSFQIKKDYCYEKIMPKFGEKFFIMDGERIIFEFKKAVFSLLPENTIFDPRNTFEDLTLPSYRRDKTKERFVTTVSF